MTLTTKAAVEAIEEATEGSCVFRIRTKVNNLTFYSENLTREYIIKKTLKDSQWILSFKGVVALEAQEADGDWVEI